MKKKRYVKLLECKLNDLRLVSMFHFQFWHICAWEQNPSPLGGGGTPQCHLLMKAVFHICSRELENTKRKTGSRCLQLVNILAGLLIWVSIILFAFDINLLTNRIPKKYLMWRVKQHFSRSLECSCVYCQRGRHICYDSEPGKPVWRIMTFFRVHGLVLVKEIEL